MNCVMNSIDSKMNYYCCNHFHYCTEGRSKVPIDAAQYTRNPFPLTLQFFNERKTEGKEKEERDAERKMKVV